MSESVPAARTVVAALRAAGVDHVFTVPGESFLAILDELRDDPAIRTIATRHEGGAAFAAEAYAKVSRRPAACLASRAVGAANLAVGIHTALQDSSPVIALLGQVSTDARHREAFQEIDLETFLGATTKWAVEPTDPTTLGDITYAAARLAVEGRPGPTAVAFREDLLTTEVAPAAYEPLRPARPHASQHNAAEVLRLIQEAERPLILAGLDVIATRAATRLTELAEREHVPVAAIWRRPDAFPNAHELYVGHPGLGVLPCVIQTLRQADLWVVVGDRLDENTTAGYALPRPGTDVVHVYLDAGRLVPRGRGLGILSSADSFIDALLDFGAGAPSPTHTRARVEWASERRAAWVRQSTPTARPVRDGYVDQFAVHAAMRRLVPRGSVIVTDAGNFSSYASRYLPVHEEGTFVAPVSGAMGYALPACIGAKLARPDRLVGGTAGDGGFLMTGNELQTAAREGIAFTLVVFDNATYGTIRMHQERRYPGRPVATALGETDLAALARSLGVHGVRVGTVEEFEGAFATALASECATVIVVPADPDQISAAMYDHELHEEVNLTPEAIEIGQTGTDPGEPS
jgi:acetolactate synthase-1/2/3 large subunit